MFNKQYDFKELNLAPMKYRRETMEIKELIAIFELLQLKQMLTKQISAPLSLEKNNYTTHGFVSAQNKALLSKAIEEIDNTINQKLSKFPEDYQLQILDFIAESNLASDSNEQELSGDFSKSELED